MALGRRCVAAAWGLFVVARSTWESLISIILTLSRPGNDSYRTLMWVPDKR